MRYLKSFICAAALTAGLATPSLAGDWIRADSPHFTVYSDTSDKVTKRYTQQLEYFRALTALLVGNGDEDDNEPPFVVYLLKNGDDLGKIRPEFSGSSVAGVFFNCYDGVQAYGTINKNTTDGNQVRGQDDSQLVLFHEYSHYVMYHYEQQLYPSWYVEGFADYLATTTFGEGKVVIGNINGWRASSGGQRADSPYGIADKIDYADLLNPYKADGKPKEFSIYAFYGQAWLLTHYMLSDPERNKALRLYFRRLAAGEDRLAAWEAATGIKVKDLEGVLSRYSARMPYREMEIKDLVKAEVEITRHDAGADSYLVTASALTTCPSDKLGKTLLDKLEGQAGRLGGDQAFNLALARARILYGGPDSAETETWLKARTAADPDDFEAAHLLGRLYLARAGRTEGDTRGRWTMVARGWFGKAYAIDPDNPPNLYFLAQSMSTLPGFPDTNAMNAAESAHVGEPGVYDYAGYLAYLHLLRNERTLAQAVLLPFTNDPHSIKHAARVREAVDAIRDGKTTDEVMSILHAADEELKEKEKK